MDTYLHLLPLGTSWQKHFRINVLSARLYSVHGKLCASVLRQVCSRQTLLRATMIIIIYIFLFAHFSGVQRSHGTVKSHKHTQSVNEITSNACHDRDHAELHCMQKNVYEQTHQITQISYKNHYLYVECRDQKYRIPKLLQNAYTLSDHFK